MTSQSETCRQRFANSDSPTLLILGCLAVVTAGVSIGNARWLADIHETAKPKLNTIHWPLYGFLHAPKDFAEEDLRGKLAVDFLQVYGGARRFSEAGTVYDGSLDVFGRLPTYPPLTHFLYAPIATRYPPARATQIHIGLQVGLLVLSTMMVLGRRRWPQALAASGMMFGFLFASPVGLAWAERGQFSVFPLIAFIFAMSGVLEGKYWYFVACALFASIKWSALPFLFVLFGLYVLDGRLPIKQRWIRGGSVIVILVGSLAVFPRYAVEYLNTIHTLELSQGPEGISLGQVFPSWFYKSFPFVIVCAGALFLRWAYDYGGRARAELARMALWIASCILLSMYGTNCFEHRALVLLAFIPTIFLWLDEIESPSWTTAEKTWRNLIVSLFPLVLALSLRIFLRDALFMRWSLIVWMFVGLSAVYFALSTSALLLALSPAGADQARSRPKNP